MRQGIDGLAYLSCGAAILISLFLP